MTEDDVPFTYTGFADEIAPDLASQLDLLDELGMDYLDLRTVDGAGFVEWPDGKVEQVKERLDERGFGVSSLGSPIGKVPITAPFESHLTDFRRTLDLADAFDTDYVRVFSYYTPEGEDPADHRDEVMRRMRAKVEIAEKTGVTLVHENEKGIYGDTPDRCRDLHTTIESPNFGAVFDPANYLELGVEAYPDALLQVVEFIDYLHIKDARLGASGEMVPAGEGDGEIGALLRTMCARGFDGFASIEPHLLQAGERAGYSGPDGFERAFRALEGILDRVEHVDKAR